MYLLIDFEGYSKKGGALESLGLNQNTVPCLMSYKIVAEKADLAKYCIDIKTEWLKVDGQVNRRLKDKLVTLVNKHKIKYVVYHGNYEHQLFKIIGFKCKEIDLNNLVSTALSKEILECNFKHNIEDGRHASEILEQYVINKSIPKSIGTKLANYNKMDVAKLAKRFERLLADDFETKKFHDMNNFIKLQKELFK